MTVLRIDGFRVRPGRRHELFAMAGDLKPVIQANGGGRTRLMRIAFGGIDTDLHYGEIEFETMASFATYSNAMANDPVAKELLATMYGPNGPVERTTSTIFSVIDTYGSRTEGYVGGAEIVREIDVKPGRLDDVLHSIGEMTQHTGPLGAYVRSIRLAVGGQYTGRIASVAEYPDMAALGNFLHQTQVDPDIRSIVSRSNDPDTPGLTFAISIHQEIVI